VSRTGEARALLHRRLAAFGPDVSAEERGGLVRYHRAGRLFAILRPLATRVDVAFTRLGRARSKRILDAKAARLPTLPYRVVVEAQGDVDTELLSWLRESYEAVE
jgi:hypothetical protein